MILTYKYRLLPSWRQHRVLDDILESQRLFYNAALEERIGCYRATGRSRTYGDQSAALTICRRELPEMAAIPVNIQRWTLRRLDEAYRGFFRRLRISSGKAGFPRFKGRGRWNSFGFSEFDGIRYNGRAVDLKSMPGAIRINLHRPLPNNDIRSCVFRKDGRRWWVCFHIRVDDEATTAVTGAVGVDLGISTLAYLSDGTLATNARPSRRAQRELRRRQRALSRCKRGSRRRSKVKTLVARSHRKIENFRRTYLHQTSTSLVKRYGLIAVEALNVKGLASGRLAREVHDAGWSTFIEMLRYKAARAGSQLIEVDPRYTSQDCSGCGERVPKLLRERTHSCPSCGLVLDRDENAALNVLRKAVAGLGFDNVAQWSERRTGNIIAAAADDETLPLPPSLPARRMRNGAR